MPPEVDFASRRRAAAAGAAAHAMHIDAAGVMGPDLGFFQAASGGHRAPVVLLNAQIPQLEAGGPEGPEELVAVVLQGLQPRSGSGPHGEQPPLETQGAAMGRQLGAGNLGPRLPQGRQVSALLPLLFQPLEATGQAARAGPWRGHQQREVADLAGVLAGRLGHHW